MGKETLLGHVAYSPSARGGLPGMPSWRCRAVPGWSPGSGHVAHSGASGEITLAGLAAHSEDSLGMALGVEFSGTRGEVGRHPEGSLGLGSRDTWLTRISSGRGLTA